MNLDQAVPNTLEAATIMKSPIATRVAQYVRMSTELQCYSTQNQMDAIADYARCHAMVIVRTFSDEGRSGLTLDRRQGLLSLLSLVQTGQADFKAVLVYDVSRWGRFQDIDESGYWEFICKRAGVEIHYCAEPFVNDGSLPSVILKSLKRAMAAEFSRELSIKTFAGKCRLVSLGFRSGGEPGFGLRRLVVDREGHPKEVLAKGDEKNLKSDRVMLVPGPEEEQRIVREIFRLYVDEGMSQVGIANDLNARGISKGNGFPWNHSFVRNILVNPKYIGTNVFNRTSDKLKSAFVRNPEQLWIRKENAFEPIVSQELFLKAAQIRKRRRSRASEEDLLDELRSVLEVKGQLTAKLINRFQSCHCSAVFFRHFGGLNDAYLKIAHISVQFVSCPNSKKAIGARFINDVVAELRANGATVELERLTRRVRVNGDLKLRFALAKFSYGRDGHPFWRVPDRSSVCDLTIIARLDESNTRILDYFVLPWNEHQPVKLSSENHLSIEVYRFATLDQMYRICRREHIGG